MKLSKIFAAATLAVASVCSYADTFSANLGTLALGNASFMRDNASGSFSDTWTFTLTGTSFLASAGVTSSAAGAQDLDFTAGGVYLALAGTPDTPLAGGTFAGNLGNDTNEFYSLASIVLTPNTYVIRVNGTNTPDMASYAGTIAIATAPIPEPETYALMLAGLGALGFIARRRRQS